MKQFKKSQNDGIIPFTFGSILTNGFSQDDDNQGLNMGIMEVNIEDDQWNGLHQFELGGEKGNLCQDNENEVIVSFRHFLEEQSFNKSVFTPEEEPNCAFKVLPPKEPVMEKYLKNKQKQEKFNEGKPDTTRVSNYSLADLLLQSHQFAVIEKNLFCYNPSLGYHVGLVGDKADIFIRQNTPLKLKGHITFKSSQEIAQWLKTKEQLQVSEDTLTTRKNYVAFTDCVIKISDFSIHSHNPNYYFTSVVNAKYLTDQVSRYGETFETFIQQVTGGDHSKYLRLQELFGYVISEIREFKYLLFLSGPKDSGKSIVLRLLEHMIGQDFFTNLSFEELNQPNFLCQLFGKKLNTCGETSELALNRLDVFKKLSGGDYVMARFLYGQAFKFTNKAVLLFAGNDLPIIKGIDRTNAFIQRLVVFPFSHQVPKHKQDLHLFDKLLKETPYIAQWSLIGLRRWCQNNYQFTTCEEIEEITHDYSNRNNSIKSFVTTCCIFDPDLRTHNDILESAYRSHCRNNGMIEESSKTFHKLFQAIKSLKYARFRLNEDNKFGDIGIALCSINEEVGEI